MPPVVTANATIQCIHGGRVTLAPRQAVTIVSGAGPVVCEPDLVGAPILGCPLASPGTKPCTSVLSTLPGISTSPKVMVGGRAAYVATLNGITDSVPPGALIVVDPGQTIVQG
jgi:hypothetical protein